MKVWKLELEHQCWIYVDTSILICIKSSVFNANINMMCSGGTKVLGILGPCLWMNPRPTNLLIFYFTEFLFSVVIWKDYHYYHYCICFQFFVHLGKCFIVNHLAFNTFGPLISENTWSLRICTLEIVVFYIVFCNHLIQSLSCSDSLLITDAFLFFNSPTLTPKILRRYTYNKNN